MVYVCKKQSLYNHLLKLGFNPIREGNDNIMGIYWVFEETPELLNEIEKYSSERKCFEVLKSWDDDNVDDIEETVVLNHVLSLKEAEMELILQYLDKAEENLQKALKCTEESNNIEYYLQCVKMLMIARVALNGKNGNNWSFLQLVKQLQVDGYKVSKFYINNAELWDYGETVPKDKLSYFIMTLDRLYNNVNLEIYNDIAFYFRHNYSIDWKITSRYNAKELVDLYRPKLEKEKRKIPVIRI